MDSSLAFADEFMRAHWKTYGLVELEREVEAEPDEAARRVEILTRILFEGNEEAKEKALKLLGKWFKSNPQPSLSLWYPLKLRHALYLHERKRYPLALLEIEALIRLDPDSAALHALRGNLLGKQDIHQAAIESFDLALSHAPDWVEPELEKLERLLLSDSPERALLEAERYQKRTQNDLRVQIVLATIRIVAKTHCDVDYAALESTERRADMAAVESREIPVKLQEEWKFDEIGIHLSRKTTIDAAVRHDISQWLGRIQKRLMPGALS